MMLTAFKKCYDQSGQHVKKHRRYFANKDCLVKGIVFPVILHGCECWTIKLSTEELMLLNCGVGEDF